MSHKKFNCRDFIMDLILFIIAFEKSSIWRTGTKLQTLLKINQAKQNTWLGDGSLRTWARSHTYIKPSWAALPHVPSLSTVPSYTFHSYAVTLQAVCHPSGMEIIPSSLLTSPASCSFQPDLICRCAVMAASPGLTCPAWPWTFQLPLIQPPPDTLFFQARLSTKPRDLFKFSKMCYFILRLWSMATAYSFLSHLVN